MNKTLSKLLGRRTGKSDIEPLGEDMAPSPGALAERTALSSAKSKPVTETSAGPFRTAANAPARDFTG